MRFPRIRISSGVRSRARVGPWKVLGIVVTCIVAAGSRPDCDRRPNTLSCEQFTVVVKPGSCVDFSNPCDESGDFLRVDGFRLCDAPDGFFVRTMRRDGVTTRQLCIAASVTFTSIVDIEYIYSNNDEFGEGIMRVTPGDFGVTASADPAQVSPGETVFLSANVFGGTPPYAFSWSSDPLGHMDPGQFALQNPVVNPTRNVTYTVEVTDDIGNKVSGSVDVGVDLDVVVSSDATGPIMPGESVTLFAVATGGAGDYSYNWAPAAGLSDTAVPEPVATPATTTTYSCVVNDGAGATASGQVLVEVEGSQQQLSACIEISPSNPGPAEVVTFDSGCSEGDIVYYRWWVDDLVDPILEGPYPTIQYAFDVPGTYYVKLEVTERDTGATATATDAVIVE